MVSSFIIENMSTQKQITFGQDIDFDYLFDSDGLDWGSVPATHNVYNYPNQVGVSISSTKINERDVSIIGYVYYFMSEDEIKALDRDKWVAYAYEKIKDKKELLSQIINPSDFVRIMVGNYYIEGKPSSSVKYGVTEAENNQYFCKFLINVYCNNPMFKKNTITKTVLSGETPGFFFPLVFPENEGIIMGVRNNYLLLAVENEGNVEIGGKIILKAKGELKNPTIKNLSTEEKITINKTMHNGEIITINTVNGKDRGIIGEYNGVTQSYLQYWNFENTWFKFQQGTTLIGYSTEDSNESLLNVSVEINPEKFNLEDM